MHRVAWTTQLPYLLLTGGGLVWGTTVLLKDGYTLKTRIRKFAQVQSFMSGSVPLMLMGAQHILQPDVTRSAMARIHNLKPDCSTRMTKLQTMHGTLSLSLGIIVLTLFIVSAIQRDGPTSNTLSIVSLVVAAIVTALGVASLRAKNEPKDDDERLANKMHQAWAFTSAAILAASSTTQLVMAH